ncbi:hypothetical protein [Microbulbifer sp. TYP-18]|uniref:hypothetical protein n=1 Tax=Microbulbifer sp. TYP-18 TaxID=3230024 RepID=UPI0034C6DB89
MAGYEWPLGDGTAIEFHIYEKNESWDSVAGLYIFSYKTPDGSWCALYVGQTDDFSSRLPSHERWDEAHGFGATHVHAIAVTGQWERDVIEKCLVEHLQPQMNSHHR